MADLLPPWSIDSLDNLKSSIDNLTLTLDSPLYQTSVTLWDAYGSVNATATVSAAASKVQSAQASITANASVEANAVRILYASASITSPVNAFSDFFLSTSLLLR